MKLMKDKLRPESHRFFDNKFLMKPVATAEREARLYKLYRSQGMDSYKAYLKSRS